MNYYTIVKENYIILIIICLVITLASHYMHCPIVKDIHAYLYFHFGDNFNVIPRVASLFLLLGTH